MSLHFLLISTDKEELDDHTNCALLLFRKVSDMEGMIEYYSNKELFAALLPGNQHQNPRVHRVTSENAADLMPIFQPWQGCKQPVALMKNHLGGLFEFDPFDESLQAYNSIVCGSTGSGKSFTTNYLLLPCLMQKFPILIIDLGGSYRKLCSLFDGQYIEVERGIRLNPFFSYKEMSLGQAGDGCETQISFLMSLLERLIIEKNRNERGLLNVEKAILREQIERLYHGKNQGTHPRLQDFLHLLDTGYQGSNKEPVAKRLADQLKLWCEGKASEWLNHKDSLALTSPFVVLDMKGLSGDLRDIILLILIGHSWTRITKLPGPKMVVLDEVWNLLEDPATSSFVAELYRTARKYHCGIMSISQSPLDFVHSTIGPAIISNSIVRYILRLKDGFECLGNSLKMNEREIQLTRQLRFKKGHYSEMFLSFGDRRAVLRVEPSPLEYWICTNHPKDLQTERQLQEKYPDLCSFDVVRLLAKIYPKGSWHEKEVH